MPRNTQLVEIDLRSGIVTNESPYVVGRRLWRAQNAVWNYPYPRLAHSGATGPWMLRQPLTFPYRATYSYTGAKSMRDIGFNAGTSSGLAAIGANSSDQYAMWDAFGGAEIGFDATAARGTISSATKRHGCSVYWKNPGVHPRTNLASSSGAFIFSHEELSTVYYMFGTDTTIYELGDSVSNVPSGASALAVHLDRLWLAHGSSGMLWYTDPLNLNSIRTTNVVNLGNEVPQCLVPGQLGTIDASGVPHLIIGNRTSVMVLDGDPTVGNASLRTLSSGIGMAGPNVAALTPYGVFFLGTDGNLWHIPLGTAEMRPVGDAIRDRLGANLWTGTIDADATATGCLAWFDPYLYMFPGGDCSNTFLARASARGVEEFWGPVTISSNLDGREAIVRPAPYGGSGFAPSGKSVPSIHSLTITPTAGAASYLSFDQRTGPTGSYPDGANKDRAAFVQSGLINVPQHRVQPARVLLETMKIPQTSAPQTVVWRVDAYDERGNTVLGALVPEPAVAAGTYQPMIVATQHFVFPPLPAARGISVKISASTEANLALHRAFVELRVTPEQF